jgi:hypothetical protein
VFERFAQPCEGWQGDETENYADTSALGGCLDEEFEDASVPLLNKAMAMTAVDLLAEPAVLSRVSAEFRGRPST